MRLKSKDLLGLQGMEKSELAAILDRGAHMKKLLMQDIKKTSHLKGRSVLTLFYENSTRTRVSFEMAGKFMSASVANISASASSVAKGESLVDTGRTLDAMATDIIIIRHPMAGAPQLLARNVKASVVNAGDGMHEHPTQALLDMFTMREKFGSLQGLEVTIAGDLLHSRVVRSNIWGLTTMGAHVTVCGPATLIPPGLEQLGVRVVYDMDEACRGANVLMALRIQKERQESGLFPSLNEYSRVYGIDERRRALCDPGCLIMHPGPVNRGVEIMTETVESEASVINEQVTNGMAVRMGILDLLAGNGAEV